MSSSPTSLRSTFLAKVFRSLPFYSGCGNLSNKKQFKKLLRGSGPVWAQCRWGSWLKCYLDDYVGRSVYYFGDLDPKLSWILQTVLRPGDSFVDVGANIGLLTTLGSQLVGPEGRVLAVEPQPRVLRCLREALERNQYKNVTIAACGVAKEEGRLQLHVPAGNLGSASFSSLPAREVETFDVEVSTLSNLMEKHQLSQARLIKLDVEDWEAEVIAGALEIWRKNPPPAIIYEHREKENISSSEAGQLLQELGYQFYRIPRKWLRPQLIRSDKGFSPKVTHDVFAVHESTNCQELGFPAACVINKPGSL